MNASVWISISGLGLYFGVWGFAQWQHRATKKLSQVRKATGICKVIFEPEALDSEAISSGKVFNGALEGWSKREVLDISDHDAGGPGYMHVERVVGTLDGRSGTFLLAYSGIKDDGTSFGVLPGSGTGSLNGISGRMTIRIRGGEQVYDFEYTLNTPTARGAFRPQWVQGDPGEQKGDTGRIVRSVLAAMSVLADQQLALQRAGAYVLHVQRLVQR